MRTRRRPPARVVLAALLGLALAGAGAVAIAEPPRGGYAPDPAGASARKQWVFDIRSAKGKTSIARVRPITLDRAEATARVTGRFAVELYIGKELLDRVRFNVPLTGDAPEKDPHRPFRRPTFDGGVSTRLKVQMADSPRATWVKLVDRLTGAEERFWWPPGEGGKLTPMSRLPGEAEVPAAAGDAGVVDAALVGDGGPPPADGGRPADGGPRH